MEQIKEMTAQESLKLISETLNNSRRSILRNNSKGFILWGVLLTVMSLVVYFAWHATGNAIWNLLWFAMPAIGYPLSMLLYKKKDSTVPQSFVGKLLGQVWGVFGVFSLVFSALAVFVVPMPITFTIVLLLGLAESISGVILKNWPIIIGGFILGVGGAVAATLLKTDAQILLFTLGGIVLAATGLIVKCQYK